MAGKKKYFDMESVGEEVGFGKYEYTPLIWVIENDVDYLTWMYTQYNFQFSKILTEFIDEILKGHYYSFREVYLTYLLKEKEAKEQKKEESKKTVKEQPSSLDSKLNFLNAIAANAKEQAAKEEQYAQQEWLEYVIHYFDSCNMEDDTESGKLKWVVDEKKSGEVKRRTIYRADTKMGSILLLEEAFLKEDGKWHLKIAFVSPDRKLKQYINKNNRGNIKNLREQIKKQCS